MNVYAVSWNSDKMEFSKFVRVVLVALVLAGFISMMSLKGDEAKDQYDRMHDDAPGCSMVIDWN